VLGRNELGSNAPYGKKLWQRLRHAHYWPNLDASLRVIGSAGEERWESLAARLNRPLLDLLRGTPVTTGSPFGAPRPP
jgi:hypothetical protein